MAKKTKKDIEYESVQVLIEDINKSVGAGTIFQGENKYRANIEAIPTGALNLDMAIGIGGIPKGRITEIYGPEASGKTTLALTVVANAQKAGGIAAFIDVEHAVDPVYAEAIGVDMTKILFSQPDSAESALDVVETLCKSGLVDLIVIDSVAALVPQAELEGNMGDSHIGLQARLLSQACRKLKGIANSTNTAIIFINQIRHKIGVMFGSPEVTSGGKALPYYASLRLDIRKTGTLKDGNEKVANSVRVKIVKNKVGSPFKEAEFDIIFGKGINKAGCLLDFASDKKVIQKAGSHYSYGDVRLGNGKIAACAALEENPEMMEEIRIKSLGSSAPKIEPDSIDEDSGFVEEL